MAHLRRILLPAVLCFAAAMFLLGITWGLPSRAADRYLFGDRTPWTGAEVLALTGGWNADPKRGADVDANPLGDRSKPVALNDTDRQRAEIMRRYRLFTYQPDEWNTMSALAGMQPGRGKLDPRMYHYGGLWVYPVGALLKVASLVGFVRLTPDIAHYLDHPEDFARFYVVARLYVAGWGCVGAWCVFWLTRRCTTGLWLPAAAGACYAMMPVVVHLGHEAKPHVPAAVLMMLAVAAACNYVETGARRWVLWCGVACGAAMGMLVSALPIALIVPTMVLLRRVPVREAVKTIGVSAFVAAAVYLATNPYVPINLLFSPETVRSTLGHSTSMYAVGSIPAGIANAVRLILLGASVPVVAAAAACLLVTAMRRTRAAATSSTDAGVRQPSRAARRRTLAWLLAAPCAAIFAQFVLLGANKPAEYARFALFIDLSLLIAAFAGLAAVFTSTAARRVCAIAILAMTAIPGGRHLAGFVRDSSPAPSRLRAADDLQRLRQSGMTQLAVYAEPAPYVLPPVDLFEWQLLLLPLDSDATKLAPGAVLVRPAESANPLDLFVTPMSWAAKPFEIRVDDPEAVRLLQEQQRR